MTVNGAIEGQHCQDALLLVNGTNQCVEFTKSY